jgi:hypothetical protein
MNKIALLTLSLAALVLYLIGRFFLLDAAARSHNPPFALIALLMYPVAAGVLALAAWCRCWTRCSLGCSGCWRSGPAGPLRERQRDPDAGRAGAARTEAGGVSVSGVPARVRASGWFVASVPGKR